MAISIAENLIEVRKRLERAARKAGRDLSEITLIAATKGVEVKRIKEGVNEGLRVFGENYIQEAQEKIKKIGDKKKKWHFIGHLQKNKARFAVELFECIHSVDTPGLAREINRRTTRPIDILIQVNITGEKTKHGATPDEAIEIARLMPGLKNLNFRGLMAIPPAVELPERSRPYFVTIRRLAERINRERIPGVTVHDLSMGMSNDFDIAIEEGATLVRVGTAIFGARESAAKETKAVKEALTSKEKPTATAKKKPAPSARASATKKTVAAIKEKGSTGKVKTTKAATAKTAAPKKSAAKPTTKTTPKTTTTAAKKALKAATTKKTALKKKTATAAAVKTTAKKATVTKVKKTATPKAVAKKTTADKKSAPKVTKKTPKVKAGETKKAAKTAAKKTTASKKKSK